MGDSVALKIRKIGIVYILLMFCSLLVSQPALIGHIPGKIKYIIGTIIIMIALFSSVQNGYLKIKLRDAYYFFICILPYVIILIYTIFQTLVLKRPDFINSLTTILYWIIPIMVMQSVIILLGEKAVDYTFYAMAANYLVCILVFLYRNGLNGIINFFEYATAYGSILETHELTLTMGMIILYYLLFDQGNEKKRRRKLLLSSIIFLMGFKRIAILSLPIAVIAFWFANRRSYRASRLAVNLMSVVGLGIFILYIYLISSGYVMFFVELYNIETMSRMAAYEYFRAYYEISPAFMGQGVGFVMSELESVGSQLYGIGDLHNDVLKMYIELGFIGSLLFFINMIVFQTNRLFKKFDYRVGVKYFTLVVYTLVLCLTDNILRYSTYLIVLFMIPYVNYIKTKNASPDRG